MKLPWQSDVKHYSINHVDERLLQIFAICICN